MKTLVTSTNWEGMPCTLRYDSGKPVAVGDVVGQLIVKGGSAPHHCGSTGYVYTDQGLAEYVTVAVERAPNKAQFIAEFGEIVWNRMCNHTTRNDWRVIK